MQPGPVQLNGSFLRCLNACIERLVEISCSVAIAVCLQKDAHVYVQPMGFIHAMP